MLKDLNYIDETNISSILNTHHFLTQIFRKISGLEKRSLASKYLHFHFPNLFFIYDSRAKNAITALAKTLPELKYAGSNAKYTNADREYRIFCHQCLILCRKIKQTTDILLNPRELDNLLLFANLTQFGKQISEAATLDPF